MPASVLKLMCAQRVAKELLGGPSVLGVTGLIPVGVKQKHRQRYVPVVPLDWEVVKSPACSTPLVPPYPGAVEAANSSDRKLPQVRVLRTLEIVNGHGGDGSE
jgi:hypothetical protein